MTRNHVPFWIASDLLAQARAHGIEPPAHMKAWLVELVRNEQRGWFTERRLEDLIRRPWERRARRSLWDWLLGR